MNKNLLPLIVAVFVVIGGFLSWRYFRGRDRDAWVCQNGEWIKQGEPEGPQPDVPCVEGEVKEEEKSEGSSVEKVTLEESRQIAQKAAEDSPTYKYDGFDLKLESSEALLCAGCWEFTFSFSSRHAGYGDRTGQMLAQVVTSHQIRVAVENGKVMVVVTDRTYDELNQRFLK